MIETVSSNFLVLSLDVLNDFFLIYILDSLESSFGDAQDLDGILASIKDLEIKPEQIREFLPKVNWDRLASMYVVGHTAAECEARYVYF